MSKRIKQINELVRLKLAEIISRDLEMPANLLITITKAETSPDMKQAKIFISVLPEDKKGTALKILRKNSFSLTQILKKNLTTKFTPSLKFIIDEQEVFASEIDKLLDEL